MKEENISEEFRSKNIEEIKKIFLWSRSRPKWIDK